MRYSQQLLKTMQENKGMGGILKIMQEIEEKQRNLPIRYSVYMSVLHYSSTYRITSQINAVEGFFTSCGHDTVFRTIDGDIQKTDLKEAYFFLEEDDAIDCYNALLTEYQYKVTQQITEMETYVKNIRKDYNPSGSLRCGTLVVQNDPDPITDITCTRYPCVYHRRTKEICLIFGIVPENTRTSERLFVERNESYLPVAISETSPRTGFWVKPKAFQS